VIGVFVTGIYTGNMTVFHDANNVVDLDNLCDCNDLDDFNDLDDLNDCNDLNNLAIRTHGSD